VLEQITENEDNLDDSKFYHFQSAIFIDFHPKDLFGAKEFQC
jgi:hypothetical protein